MTSSQDQMNIPQRQVRLFKSARELLELYIVAFTGAWLAHLVHFPAAWLTGALLAVAVYCLFGVKRTLPMQVRDIGFAQVGLILGSGFSPEMLHAISAWPISLLMLAATVVLISAAAYTVLRRIGGWDHATALFSSLPGALSYVMVIAEQAKADMTRVAIAQTLRVFVLITLLPLVLAPFIESERSAGGGGVLADSTPIDPQHLGLMLLALAILAPVAIRLKLPSGLMLSGMAVSGTLYLTGIYHDPLPQWFTIPGYLTIGILIGTRFSAIGLKDLAALSGVSLLSLLVSALVSALAAVLCASLLGFPMGQVILAFAPGGFDTMVLLSFLIDLNPAFVAGHHLVRFLGLVILAPIVMARLVKPHDAGFQGSMGHNAPNSVDSSE